MKNNKQKKSFPNIPKSVFDHENWSGEDSPEKESSFGRVTSNIFLVTVFIVLMFIVVTAPEDKIINQKCTTLENQSKEFETFFVTYTDKVACDRAGFTFAGTREAPVHVDTIPKVKKLQAGVWYTNDFGMWTANTNHNYINE